MIYIFQMFYEIFVSIDIWEKIEKYGNFSAAAPPPPLSNIDWKYAFDF